MIKPELIPLEKLVDTPPSSDDARGASVVLLSMAKGAMDSGRTADGVAQLLVAHRLWPDLPQIAQSLGSAYITLAEELDGEERYNLSEIAFFQAIKVCPDPKLAKDAFATCLYKRGIAHYNKREYIEAERLLRRALNLNPDFAEVQAGLAYVTLRQGVNMYDKDPEKAEVFLQECLMLRPGFPEAMDIMPSTLFNRGIALYTKSHLFDAEVAIGELLLHGAPRSDFGDTITLVHNQAWKLRLVEPQNDDQVAIIAKADIARRDSNRNRRQVVLIAENMRSRTLTIARGLMRAGMDVILLYRMEPNFPLDGACTESFRFETNWQALEIASRYRPAAYHVFSSNVDPTLIAFIRYKPGPVIYDYQDIFPGLIPGFVVNTVGVVGLWQTQALAEADGLCCQDLLYRSAAQINGWERNPNLIWFPHYVEEASIPAPAPAGRPLRMISSGIIEDPEGTLDAAKHFFYPLLDAGISLELYLHPNKKKMGPEERREKYRDLLDKTSEKSTVEMMDFVDPDTLVERARHCDAGTILKVALEKPNEPVFYEQAYFDNSLSGRVCEYLAAGLVILGMRDLRMSRFISRRYGRWFDVEDITQAGAIEKLQAMIDSSRQETRMKPAFTLDYNIPRLIKFYERTCDRVIEQQKDTM